MLLWTGAPGDAPACPTSAPEQIYEGYADLQYEPSCPACACGPAPCQLPEGIKLTTYADCYDSETGGILYPAPQDWTGECISTATIPAEVANWIRWMPTTLGPCAPIEVGDREGSTLEVRQLGVACGISGVTVGCDDAHGCAPAGALPEGFRACIFSTGERSCPADLPERHVLWEGVDVSAAGCTPCACQAPQGGKCDAQVRVYMTADCSNMVMGNYSVLGDSGCGGPVIPGYAVRSFEASWWHDDPGSCEPVPSEPTGAPVLTSPTTFCCAQ